MTDPPTTICTLADLLDWAGQERFDSRAARELTRFLRARGLSSSPSVRQVLTDIGEQRWSADWHGPGRVIEGEPLRTTVVRIRPTRAPLIAGAASLMLIAVSVSWYRWAPYGVVALAAGGAATAAAWRWFDKLDRRLPSGLSRGAILGAGVVLTATLVALAIFVVGRHLAGAAT